MSDKHKYEQKEAKVPNKEVVNVHEVSDITSKLIFCWVDHDPKLLYINSKSHNLKMRVKHFCLTGFQGQPSGS